MYSGRFIVVDRMYTVRLLMTSVICLLEISYSGKTFNDTTTEDKDLIDIFDHLDNFKDSNK
jgi:hypothetical protein